MVESLFILALIFILLLSFVATVVFLLSYLGILGRVNVTVGKPIIKNVWIAYKPQKGPYQDCGPHFTEACSLRPDLPCIGIYYDDPETVPKEDLRYIVGLILSEAETPPEDLVSLVTNHGFRIAELPAIDYAVKAEFPFVMDLCGVIGAWKVYPALGTYITERKLSAHPFLEIYLKNKIHYMGPLSKQSDFFVPEVKYNVYKSDDSITRSPGVGAELREDSSDDDQESQTTTSSFEDLGSE
ncbi:unnamed protein product [Clavelina lepadiformis]|uniref:Testis-expressed sequence 264 protein n=1 Tax=Clavelina lepadiformis TaxID=159417 RepID=A0ABP0FN06_CLALP